MAIKKAKYSDKNNKGVILFFDDNSMSSIPSLSDIYEYTSVYNEWISNGGDVEPYETDIEVLNEAKVDKIKAIDTQTSTNIESLVGDNNKQKDLLAESIYLSRLEKKDISTPEQIERLDLLESLNMQVLNLKYDGNNREAIVSNIEITTTLENALAEIGAV